MKILRNKTAFSLIELSIVILVIGVLIAGVTKGSKLVTKFRISSAKTLTESSPVASIQDLVAWYETVSDDSFLSTEALDGSEVTIWRDINPQNIRKHDLSAATNNTAIYTDKLINGLPALDFDGSAHYTNSKIEFSEDKFIFLVLSYNKEFTTPADQRIVTLVTEHAVGIYNNGAVQTNYHGQKHHGLITSGQSYVLGFYSKGLVTGAYVNGESISEGSASDTHAITGIYVSGWGVAASGNTTRQWINPLGEIIIFNRALKKAERQEVEKYLGKKWNIALTQD